MSSNEAVTLPLPLPACNVSRPRCRRCRKPLRDEESVRRGHGPECWRRLHPPALRPAVRAGPARPVPQDPLPFGPEEDIDETRATPGGEG